MLILVYHFGMNNLTPEQRLQIVQIYNESHCSVRRTYRALRSIYGRHNRPSEAVIQNYMKRLNTTALNDNTPKQRRCTVRTEEVVAAVQRSIEENPHESIRHRAQQLNLVPSTLYKILRKDLGVKAMAEISTEDLRTEVNGILKTADLSDVSAKMIREQVEQKLKCSLQNRKKELDSIVKDFINQQQFENEEVIGEDGVIDDNVNEVKISNKSLSAEKNRSQPTKSKTPTNKKKRTSSTAADTVAECDSSN